MNDKPIPAWLECASSTDLFIYDFSRLSERSRASIMSFSKRPQLLCLLCQWRTFSTSYRRFAKEAEKAASKPSITDPASSPSAPQKFIPPSPLENAPRGYGKRVEEFTPVPLPRPIGMPHPPEPGQNTGIDNRSVRQKRDDFVNWDKHLVRREQLYVGPLPGHV